MPRSSRQSLVTPDFRRILLFSFAGATGFVTYKDHILLSMITSNVDDDVRFCRTNQLSNLFRTSKVSMALENRTGNWETSRQSRLKVFQFVTNLNWRISTRFNYKKNVEKQLYSRYCLLKLANAFFSHFFCRLKLGGFIRLERKFGPDFEIPWQVKISDTKPHIGHNFPKVIHSYYFKVLNNDFFPAPV